MPKSEIETRVTEVLKLVKMSELGARKPAQLSGGQRQRVALARCLVKRLKVLLLDEPLAALDKTLRKETRQELLTIQRALGLTFIVVTRDQEEAMHLAKRIGMMDQGRIVQVGTPDDIYEHPKSIFVAGFVGRLNKFQGRFQRRADGSGEITDTLPLSLPGVLAGCLLVFIPSVGQFVIPALLSGDSTLMIGRVMWNEFFSNRDWPVASAAAMIMLVVLVVPIMLFQRTTRKEQ